MGSDLYGLMKDAGFDEIFSYYETFLDAMAVHTIYITSCIRPNNRLAELQNALQISKSHK